MVEVTEGLRRVATLSELGGTEPSEANIAKVKFTVRPAGVHRSVVLVGICHVQGSPFHKKFLPGKVQTLCMNIFLISNEHFIGLQFGLISNYKPVKIARINKPAPIFTYFSKCVSGPPIPRNTVFVRHSSTVVCTAKTPYPLHIEP